MNRTGLSLLALSLLLSASVASADTRTGNANRRSVQSWSFVAGGTGQMQIIVNWTNTNARLLLLVLCGVDEPLVYGVASGSVNRLGMVQFAAPPGVPCLAGVSAVRGSSAYRIHFLRDESATSTSQGRSPLALDIAEANPSSILAYWAERTMELYKARASGY